MSERISKTQRWLDLIAFLVGRKFPVEVDHIMEAVPAYAEKYLEGDDTARDTVRRMFERDKDELRTLGIPIETVSHPVNYGTETVQAYRMASRDFYLPYLRLLSESGSVGAQPTPRQKSHAGLFEMRLEDAHVAYEALAELRTAPWFPFRSEAGSALRKLSYDVPGYESGPPVLYVDRPDAAEVSGRVRVLAEALHARKRVKFEYHGIERGHTTERDVAPYGLLFQKGHWYLVGRDETRDGVRVFRVGRMGEPLPNTKTPKTADYEIPHDFTLDEYRNRDAWDLGGADEPPIQCRVRFEFPTSLWAERNGYGTLVEELSDGSTIRRFEVRQVAPFLRWILGLEGRARVVSPPEIASGVVSLARETLAVYRSAAAGVPGAGAPSSGATDAGAPNAGDPASGPSDGSPPGGSDG